MLFLTPPDSWLTCTALNLSTYRAMHTVWYNLKKSLIVFAQTQLWFR